jgi:NitT/TauT family transport system substrate-binding protein
VKIRIGHLSTFYHTAILLMADSGTSARLGAEIEWRLMGTGPEIVRAFQAGELDIAYLGLPPAMIGISRGADIVCVAGGHEEGTVMAGRAAWDDLAASGSADAVLRQFVGRRIGVPGKGSIHDVILRDWIRNAGLTGSIEVVNYPWADLVTEAVVHDEVAAAVGTPALAVAIMRFADGHVLCPPSSLWPNNPSYGIVVDRAYLERKEGLVERFLRMHEEAAEMLRNRPADAAEVIAKYVSIVDTRFVLDTIMISPKYCAQLTDEYVASTMKFIPVLKDTGFIKNDIGKEMIFFNELIRRVHPGAGHYGDSASSISSQS